MVLLLTVPMLLAAISFLCFLCNIIQEINFLLSLFTYKDCFFFKKLAGYLHTFSCYKF